MIDLNQIHICPGTLKEGFSGYSPAVHRHLFGGKKVSHILDFAAPRDEHVIAEFQENRERLSISGVQEKVSMVLDGRRLRLTKSGASGAYILKPIPHDLNHADDVPANEHLSMQIAARVFGIQTAQNALIFFEDGSPAYITRRFDVRENGSKWAVEDFATLAGRSESGHGAAFKYDYSYLGIGELIRRYVAAYPVEMERYLEIVVFNYLISNGDAHLKNFSLRESPDSDYLLSPFYDLINTRIHVADTALALRDGLFDEAHRSPDYRHSGHPVGTDFVRLGMLLGISESRSRRLVMKLTESIEQVERLIEASYLSDRSKNAYRIQYRTRLKRLRKIK